MKSAECLVMEDLALSRKRLEDGLEPGLPTPVPLEVGLLTLVNRGPKIQQIIELLDWQDQPDQYIMVLERPSPCEDLWEFIAFQEDTLNEDTTRYIMAQATMAAHMCCCRGVFHSDIKLENLLINPETLEVKLIDFGCGDLLQESAYDIFCGTEDYCPPEFYTERTSYYVVSGSALIPVGVWTLSRTQRQEDD